MDFSHMTQLAEMGGDERTPVQQLYDELELDKDSSYEQYIIKVNQAYNHEVDMYGDIMKAGERQPNMTVLDFGVPIPHDQLSDERIMFDMRDTFRFNPDIPGAIENVNPNKFISSKFLPSRINQT